ncbi:MAG: hypothetical protein COV29_01765 [Candidatus Yanofskybacteria bacterium CG10_big_fil_rev_8_21_14_0_10_36_16]|uniref:Uncharacterized protein n=1 Tax=Candidatus Yanofskybacteria bacterium CG10_big_fil_rev_8_21_14_0_10_36_16 TaxID=1975096 RepID=A0A2J0Q7D4_9BACT|nr:MAG: hypothetical protein COV29_01765 [Candidatus Yanofskybacteria bacterium CG10_big_fil_rev_8_21_14_0_10_36_16]
MSNNEKTIQNYIMWLITILVSFHLFSLFLALAYFYDRLYLLGSAIALALSVNWIIAALTDKWHRESGTGESFVSEHPSYSKLKRLVGLFEILFYAFVFVFNQMILLAAWLVVKALGGFKVTDSHGDMYDNPAAKKSASSEVFRLGTLLSVAAGYTVAILVQASGVESTKLFDLLARVFN